MDSVTSADHDRNYFPWPKISFLVDRPQGLICDICKDSHLVFNEAPTNGVVDDTTPGILPCGHVAGFQCLSKSVNQDQKCPFCRLALRYPLCKHKLLPRPINAKTICALPKTIPEGGAIAAQCGYCQVVTSETVQESVGGVMVDMFKGARDAYKAKPSAKNKARMLAIKSFMENALEQNFRQMVSSIDKDWD